MKVNERDIFNFVFYPGLVREEIKMFLHSIEDSTDAIIFYKELKDSLNSDLSIETKKKISEKIPIYEFSNIIQLYPVEENKKKRNSFTLAAASPEETPKIVTKTFYDEDKSYIIKVINYEKNSKIFVFSTQQEVIKNFDLIIQPQNEKYHIKDNLIPLELADRIHPDSIQIEFNLSEKKS